MDEKQSFSLNHARCIVYASGMNSDSVANRIEQYAYEHDLEIVDIIIRKEPGADELTYYLENESIEAILLRTLADISTDKKEIKKILIVAAKHGISVNCEDVNFEPLTVNIEDDI